MKITQIHLFTFVPFDFILRIYMWVEIYMYIHIVHIYIHMYIIDTYICTLYIRIYVHTTHTHTLLFLNSLRLGCRHRASLFLSTSAYIS